MKKLIRVTQEDINRGERANRQKCPIALALARTFKRTVWVGNVHYEIAGRKWEELPERVVEFINAFDKLQSVQPFNFYVQVKVG